MSRANRKRRQRRKQGVHNLVTGRNKPQSEVDYERAEQACREQVYTPLVPIIRGKYRAAKRPKQKVKTNELLEAKVVSTRNGWHRGVALLNKRRIFEGRPTRDYDAAWAYAEGALRDLRCGVEHLRRYG